MLRAVLGGNQEIRYEADFVGINRYKKDLKHKESSFSLLQLAWKK
jgi:hypothetical protein